LGFWDLVGKTLVNCKNFPKGGGGSDPKPTPS